MCTSMSNWYQWCCIDAIDSTRLPPVVLYFSFHWWHPLMKPSIMPPGILWWNHCKCQWPCMFPVLLISFLCSRDIFHWDFARLKLTFVFFVFFPGGWMKTIVLLCPAAQQCTAHASVKNIEPLAVLDCRLAASWWCCPRAGLFVAQAWCLTVFNLSPTQNTCLLTYGNKASVCINRRAQSLDSLSSTD